MATDTEPRSPPAEDEVYQAKVHCAYHEAGHALLWHLQGLPFDSATILEWNEGPSTCITGKVVGDYPIPDAPPEARDAARLGKLALGYGGLIGETWSPYWHAQHHRWGWKLDMEQNDAWIAEWYPAASAEEREAIRYQANTLANRLMGSPPADNVERIQKLAQALLQQGTLTYQQALDAMNDPTLREEQHMNLFGRKAQAAPQADPQGNQGVSQGTASGPQSRALTPSDKLAHQREMAAMKAQERRERREEERQQRQEKEQRRKALLAVRQQQKQERREAWRALAGRVRTFVFKSVPSEEEQTSPIERIRREIESFEEDKEDLGGKLVRKAFTLLAYAFPFLIAYFVGREIGDYYGGTPLNLNDGWNGGMHMAAWGGEAALGAMVISTARAWQRYKKDPGMGGWLFASTAAFLIFTLASCSAQWVIGYNHLKPQVLGDYAGLVFRVVMPTAIDIASLLWLGIMRFKSLHAVIDEKQRKAKAIRLINEVEIEIEDATEGAKQRRAQVAQAMAVQQKFADLVTQMSEISGKSMVHLAEIAMSNASKVHLLAEPETENRSGTRTGQTRRISQVVQEEGGEPGEADEQEAIVQRARYETAERMAAPRPIESAADQLQRTIEALTATPDITDEELAEVLGLKKTASARFWRLRALEVLTGYLSPSTPGLLAYPPFPATRTAPQGVNHANHGDIQGEYERWGAEGEGSDGDTSFREHAN